MTGNRKKLSRLALLFCLAVISTWPIPSLWPYWPDLIRTGSNDE
jgi:hypothetical protein